MNLWCFAVSLWLASGAAHLPPTCLPGGIKAADRRNFTAYSYTGPLKLYTLKWSSALVATKIGKILLEEVFGYHVSDSDASWQAMAMIEALSGCIEGKTCMDPDGSDIMAPRCHLGFETWKGIGMESTPKSNWPKILGLLEYMGEEGVYMRPGIAEAYYAVGRIVTQYLGFKAGVYNDFTDHFQTLRQILAADKFIPVDYTVYCLLPAVGSKTCPDCTATPLLCPQDCTSPSKTCWSDITKDAGSSMPDFGTLIRPMFHYSSGNYEKSTGDPANDAPCYDIATDKLSQVGKGCGQVWVAPPSRADPLGCIPIITSVDWGHFLVPQAGKYRWPVCYISGNWGDYVYVGHTFPILVYWWTPDVAFKRAELVELKVAGYDGLARSAGDVTSKAQSKLEISGWRYLAGADEGKGQFLEQFANKIEWFDPDADMWMSERSKKGSSDLKAACTWVKKYEDRWRKWIPDMVPPCPVGQELDVASGNCTKCPAGKFASVKNRDRIIWMCVTCDPGFAQPLSGQASCNACQPGEYSDAVGSTACSKCPSGTAQRAEGRSGCDQCIPGSFSPIDGEAACSDCVRGSYQEFDAQTACLNCPESFTTNDPRTASFSECTCGAGFFWNRVADKCEPCQQAGLCDGGLEPPGVQPQHNGVYFGTVNPADVTMKVSGAGKYKAGNEDAFRYLKIYICRPGECTPEYDNPAKCANEKRSGIACAICDEGYYLQTCEVCDANGPFIIILILIIMGPGAQWIGCLICAKPYASKATAAFQMASTFGIMAIFAQMLGMMGGFNMSWPSAFASLAKFAQLFLLDLEGFGLGCVVGNNFGPQYIASFLLPVVIAVSMIIMLPVSQFTPAIKGQSTTLTRDGCLNFMGMIYSALYISLVKIVVRWLECAPNPNDTTPATLISYRQVECGSDLHQQGIIPFIIGMLLYVVGFFCMCAYLNYRAPEFFAEPVFRARTKFLVNRWRVDTWYWGTVYQVRNLLLALIAVFGSSAVDQFVIMGIVMVVFLMLGCGYMPWKDIRLAQFDNSVSFVVFLAINCGIGYMALMGERTLYEQDGSPSALEAVVAIKARMSVFSTLLTTSMAFAGVLFATLIVYCIWWMKNTAKIGRQEEAMFQMFCTRYAEMSTHEEFRNQLHRYLEVGTHVDIRSFNSFLENMEARVGVAGLPDSSVRVKRLRMTKTPVPGEAPKMRTSFLAAVAVADELQSSLKKSGSGKRGNVEDHVEV